MRTMDSDDVLQLLPEGDDGDDGWDDDDNNPIIWQVNKVAK